MEYYILKNREPVKIEAATEWAKWFMARVQDRYVDIDVIHYCQIITFFDGIITEGLPKLIQTIAIGRELDGETENYFTWNEAEVGHKRMVESVKSSQ